MNQQEILDSIRAHLDRQEWTHETVGKGSVIHTGFNVDGLISDVQMFIDASEDDYLTLTVTDKHCAEGRRAELARYLTMANYGLRFGSFEMDWSDGEIRYRFAVNCEDMEELPDDILRRSIGVPVAMFEKYGDGIVRIENGESNAETEIRKAEKKRD